MPQREHRSDPRNRNRDLASHELSLEPEHAIAGRRQHPIAARIGAPPPRVVSGIDLDHEPRLWCEEVDDESASEDDLAAEDDAELARA